MVPLAYLELAREALEWHRAEEMAKKIDWERILKTNKPPQSWFDDEEDNPFRTEQESGST